MNRTARAYRSIGSCFRLSAAFAGLVVLLVAACGAPADRSGELVPGIPTVSKLANRVPAAIKAAGAISVATDPSYQPMEFRTADGLQGVDIDLARAIGSVLGLPVEFTPQAFSTIVPSVAVDRFDLGMSAFWARNVESPLVDMVTYYRTGDQFAVRVSPDAPTSTGLGLCGHSVGVEEGTDLVDELVAQSAVCRKAGKQPVRIHAGISQAATTNLLLSGRVEAMVADGPVVSYVAAHNPSVRLLGKPSQLRDYGIAVPPADGQWADVVRDAVQTLIDSGRYQQILERWDASQGAIKKSEIIPADPRTG